MSSRQETTRTIDVDVVVVGAGMAGVSAAAALVERGRSVAIVDQAATPGYHASGRSASVLSETSGHPVVCALAAASRPHFETPPEGFVEHPLLAPRGLLWVGEADDAGALDDLAAAGARINGTVRRVTPAEVRAIVPALRDPAVGGGGVHEPEAMAIDTDALLQAYLRRVRAASGQVLVGAEAVRLWRDGDGWTVTAAAHTLRARTVVNAAGAWGDVIAARAGVQPIGLQPHRRTACIAALDDVAPHWPMVMDVAGRYYFEPESGGLLISPADATATEPCDAQAEEIDVAIAMDRVREATSLPLRSVRRAWAGLRTFSPDGAPVVGEEPSAPGFWWLVGQGGAGIKTAPAMAAALAALVDGDDLPASIIELGVGMAELSPARFRSADAPTTS